MNLLGHWRLDVAVLLAVVYGVVCGTLRMPWLTALVGLPLGFFLPTITRPLAEAINRRERP